MQRQGNSKQQSCQNYNTTKTTSNTKLVRVRDNLRNQVSILFLQPRERTRKSDGSGVGLRHPRKKNFTASPSRRLASPAALNSCEEGPEGVRPSLQRRFNRRPGALQPMGVNAQQRTKKQTSLAGKDANQWKLRMVFTRVSSVWLGGRRAGS